MWRLLDNVQVEGRRKYEKSISEYCIATKRIWRPIWFDKLSESRVYKLPHSDMSSSSISYKYHEIELSLTGWTYGLLHKTTDRSEEDFYINYGVILHNNSIDLLVCENTLTNDIRIFITTKFADKNSVYKNLYKRVNEEFIIPNVVQGYQLLMVESIDKIFTDKVPKPKFNNMFEMQDYYNKLGGLVHTKSEE